MRIDGCVQGAGRGVAVEAEVQEDVDIRGTGDQIHHRMNRRIAGRRGRAGEGSETSRHHRRQL